MHYFIDGYNLLFRVSAGDDLQKLREDVIHDLANKINLLELDATIVFDAQYQNTESSRSHLNCLEIIFTAIGETADEFILEALNEDINPSRHIVVTSDKKLAWLSKRSHAKAETVEEFIAWLNRCYKNKLRSRKDRQLKNTKIQQNAVTVKSIPKTPAKTSPPLSSAPEECFEFYLERFEKDYLAIKQEAADKAQRKFLASKTSPSKKKKTKAVPKNNEDSESDIARWLRAFERDIKSSLKDL